LSIAFNQLTRRPQSRTASRYSLALGGALLGWFVLLAGALFAVFTGQDASAILPPLERVVNVSAMLLIGWAFITADQERTGNGISAGVFVLMITVVIGYLVTGVQWSQVADTLDFNLSRSGVLWAFLQGVTALQGAVLMLVYFRTVVDAPLKLLFFVILIAGYGGTLLQMANGSIIGNYSGLSRLALFIAVPIVPLVVYRKIVYGYELAIQIQMADTGNMVRGLSPAAASVPPEPSPEAAPDSSKASVAAQPLSKAPLTAQSSSIERESVLLLRALGKILEGAQPGDIPMHIVRAATDVLSADIAVLLEVSDANYADILVAYDRAMNRQIPSMMSLNLGQQVTLVNAIERRDQRPLFLDRNPEELTDLYSRLDIPQVGPAYFQPLMRDDELIAVLMVGLPYERRELRDEERELLKGMGIIAGSLLALSDAAEKATVRAEERAIQAIVAGVPMDEIEDNDVITAHAEMQSSLDAAREQNRELQGQLAVLQIELDDERTRLADLLGDTQQGLSVSRRIVALNEEQDKLREDREKLLQRLDEAETALASATGTDDEAMFKAQIETLNREKQGLVNELDLMRRQLEEMRQTAADVARVPQAAQEMLENMSQERVRLQQERDNLTDRLSEIELQLQAMGLDGGAAGLSQMVKQLYDQRSSLQVRSDALRVERDALLNERRRFEKRMRQEDERELQIEAMEAEIRHLAADREAITRQRDHLKGDLSGMAEKVDRMKQQRARLLADLSVYEEDLVEARDSLAQLQAQLRDGAMPSAERDRLLMENRSLQSERDQLLARIEGDRDRIYQLSEDARGELITMLDEITAQRDRMETELTEATVALSEEQRERQRMEQSMQAGNGVGVNSQLFVGMLEELRTPMTSVLGYIDLLVNESAGMLSKTQRGFLQRVSANVVRLETMLNDINHLAVLEAGVFELNREPVNIIQTLENGITTASYQFREKNLAVDVRLDDTIAPIMADANGMMQVVGQLLTNAYLVSPENSVVAISAEQHSISKANNVADTLIVAVRDSGGGIASDELDDVFSWRYRPDDHLVMGLGDTTVGLPIARALIEAHGGRMWVETVENVGTTFYFSLPLKTGVEKTNAS
ncbi:MAG: ATP-binding protein, partial [Chloroflexota bacterium]